MNALTTEQFIEKARKVHGDRYDYSKVNYVNNCTKVCIICPEHGEFWQRPNNHLQGYGCPLDGNRKPKTIFTTEDFIREAKKVHGDKYDYSKSVYKGRHRPITIICKKHGEFIQDAGNHLRGRGCSMCRYEKNSERQKDTTETFIEKAKIVHGDKYDYSKVEYIDSYTKVCIICPEHGEFWQRPNNHLNGLGCQKCANEHRNDGNRKTTEEFIEAARMVHGNKYDYSKTEYVDIKTKVCIICPEHGEFWQRPGNHLQGWGCSKCSESHLEKEVRTMLKNVGIELEGQKTFEWLRYENPLVLDFYLPEYNVAIECQGVQHYQPVGFGCKSEEKIHEMFELVKDRDRVKKQLCEEHGVKILYYTKENVDNENTFTNIDELKKQITGV